MVALVVGVAEVMRTRTSAGEPDAGRVEQRILKRILTLAPAVP